MWPFTTFVCITKFINATAAFISFTFIVILSFCVIQHKQLMKCREIKKKGKLNRSFPPLKPTKQPAPSDCVV